VVAVIVIIAAAVVFVGMMLVGILAMVRWVALLGGCDLSGEEGSSVSVPAFLLPKSRRVVLGSGRWVVVDDGLADPSFVVVGRQVGESSSSEPSSSSDGTKEPNVVFLWDWKRGCGRRKM